MLDPLIGELVHVLKVMVDHAKETYPHFESERGQRDIAQAEAVLEKAAMRRLQDPENVREWLKERKSYQRRRHRPNPGLVVYGNPLGVHGPSRLIGKAEELRYEWNGEFYKHPFDSDVVVQGVRTQRGRHIVLAGVNGQPLWATDAELERGEVVA